MPKEVAVRLPWSPFTQGMSVQGVEVGCKAIEVPRVVTKHPAHRLAECRMGIEE